MGGVLGIPAPSLRLVLHNVRKATINMAHIMAEQTFKTRCVADYVY